MPWEESLQQVLESVRGPVAKIIAVIIIIATGLTLGFGDTAGGFKREVAAWIDDVKDGFEGKRRKG